ncbi:uncharacterized protein LOC141881035 isoform X2 [Acropora palmata]|uniref:uncharacterized protein LOC141881035 isoform X2 n=1 Tax=Acropora palmata TaxID=6131 RepID=UPI003DA1C718
MSRLRECRHPTGACKCNDRDHMDIIQIKVYVLERRPSSGHSYSGSCFSEGDVKISELNLPYGCKSCFQRNHRTPLPSSCAYALTLNDVSRRFA